VIEAEGFVVKDARGVVRARLGLVGDEQEYAGLSLYDQQGQSRILISTAGAGNYDRATVLIKDSSGTFRAKLDVVNGVSYLLLSDAGEVPRVRLACDSAGGTLVEVLKADGSVAFSTRQEPDA
jgi:hypothetical protein